MALDIPVHFIGQMGASILSPGAANAGMSAFGGGGFSLSGIGSAVMGGYSGAGAAGFAASGGSFASTVGGGLATDAMGATVAEGTAAATIGTGALGAASAALAAIPVAGWIALAVLAASSLFGKGGGPKTESGFGTGVPLRGDSSAAQAIADAITAGYKSAADALGVTNDTLKNIGVFIGEDPKGTALSQLQVTAGSYDRGALTGSGALGENVSRDPGALADAEKLAIAQAIVKGLQDNADGAVGQWLKSMDVASASLDQLQHALQVAVDVGTFNKALEAMPFASLSSLSVDAKEKLIGLGGGLQAITQSMATYQQQFFSSDEQRAAAIQGISKSLSSVGLSLDGIDTSSSNARAQFRALMDSIDTTTDAGLKQKAMLLSVAGAFASLTQEMKSAQQLLDELATAKSNVQSATAALASFGQQLQATVANIQSQINALRGQALQALASATTTAQQQLQGFVDANSQAQTGVTAAQAALTNALQGVASAIAQAAADVQNAQDQVDAARAQITQGYLAALDKEKQVKQQITQAYLQAQDAVTAAQQRLTDAQEAAARALRNAGDTILDTLRQLAGTDAGSGNILQQYKAQRNELQALAAKAMAGDADAAGKLGSVAQSFLGVSRQRNTAAGFNADDIFVRQLLAQVMGVTGTNVGRPTDAQDAVVQAQKELADATKKLAAAQQLALSTGASLIAADTSLAAQFAAAAIEVARWSSAVQVSGASTTAAQVDILAAYKKATAALEKAQEAQTKLLAQAGAFDLSGATASVDAWQSAIDAARTAQDSLTSSAE
jgi:hypothetical protein